MNRDGTNMRWVENSYDGLDYWPDWGPDGKSIFFVSDRDGCENVYRIPSTGGPAKQLTHFTGRPVRFLSVSKTGQVAFEQDFKLQTFDLDQFNADGSAGIRVVKLDCASESKHNEEVRLDIGGSITEMALSPLGVHLALIARRGFVYGAAARSEKPAPVAMRDTGRRFGSPIRRRGSNMFPGIRRATGLC